MNVMVEDVHTRAAQMDEILSQVRENCESFISKAKQEAEDIVTETKQQMEVMKAAAMKEADNLKAEAERIVEAAHKDTEAMKVELSNWDEEKKRIASTHIFEPKIKLDVGGRPFTTTLTTLTRFPDTKLGEMFSGRHALTKDEAGVYFVDRTGRIFHEILEFLRTEGEWHSLSHGKQLVELKNEAEYYGLKDLMFPTPPIVPAEPASVSNEMAAPKMQEKTNSAKQLLESLKFVPAKPATVRSYGYNDYDGGSVTITQGNDQLWYVQHSLLGDTPVVVHVCDSCGFGWPRRSDANNRAGRRLNAFYGVQNFTSGRTISATQPRNIGTCPHCHE